MIGRLQGKLVELFDRSALVDTGGVGYELELTRAAAEMLGVPGTDVLLFTHQVVREDAHLLFGFASRPERDVFRVLIRVNGVGPRLGMALLSALSVGELAASVASGEVSRLTKVPGIGKRTAERLLVELKEKLDDIVPAGSGEAVSIYKKNGASSDRALAALMALGYRQPEAERALAGVPEDVTDTEAMVRIALRGFVRD